MKIAIDTGSKESGHIVRGIGVHTIELVDKLTKFSKGKSKRDIEILGLDFANENLSRYDLVHYTSFHPYFLTLPAEKPAKKVILTIHDLIPLIYPKHYPPGIRGRINFLKQKRRLKYVDAVITISETSKKDICRFLKVPPDKVFVVYLAAKEIFNPIRSGSLRNVFNKALDLPKRFVLYVGDVNYNKNIPSLVEACRLSNIPLVMVGKGPVIIEDLLKLNHPEHAHLEEVSKELDGKNIIRLGYLTDAELVAVYNLATVYCQPSLYEGFGLGILEAQATGCPVVAVRNQAHIEVAEGTCLFAESNPEDLSKKITQVLNSDSLRRELIKKGLVNASKYSWEKTATGTLEVYKSVLGLTK